jgi:3-isopropylmalate/(R)-2-methylmalate dehydratase small subunit
MKPFTTLTGIAAPLPLINIDTDMIIPKQFLKTIKRTGLGAHLFDEMRFTPEGKEIPEFVLNQKTWRHATILVAGENFGCGSSREHAPWALLDFGIRCVIASSFADIFYNNCFQNGICPITLPQDEVDMLLAEAKAGRKLTVDLEKEAVFTEQGNKFSFKIDPFRRDCLLKGMDAIGITLQHESAITTFEGKRKETQSWL